MIVRKVIVLSDTKKAFKGTWYERGETYFVMTPDKPPTINQWNVINRSGSVNIGDVEVLEGFMVRIQCFIIHMLFLCGVFKDA